MSEQEVKVRSVSRDEGDGLFEMAASFVGSASRVSLSVASVPLVLLPKASRRRMRRAMAEVARAVVAVPRELTDASVRVVDKLFDSEEKLELPRVEEFTDRARGFTERLSRAAEEFGASFGRATRRAGSTAGQAAAKVDEWVEKA